MRRNPTRRTGRRGPLRKDATLVDQMDRKISVKAGRAVYKRRQQFIEPVFGQIKAARGIRTFLNQTRFTARSRSEKPWELAPNGRLAASHKWLGDEGAKATCAS